MNLVLLTNGFPPLGIPARGQLEHYRKSKLAMYDGNPKHFTLFVMGGVRAMWEHLGLKHRTE